MIHDLCSLCQKYDTALISHRNYLFVFKSSNMQIYYSMLRISNNSLIIQLMVQINNINHTHRSTDLYSLCKTLFKHELIIKKRQFHYYYILFQRIRKWYIMNKYTSLDMNKLWQFYKFNVSLYRTNIKHSCQYFHLKLYLFVSIQL